jgi:hypothetical protein
VKVYDRAQGKPIDGAQALDLQPPGQPLTGDSHAHLLTPLRALAQSLGYRVIGRDLDSGDVQGWCDPLKREIVVNRQQPANARVRILVHEIAHAHPAGKLDYEHFTRQQVEVLVDTVTYLSADVPIGMTLGDYRRRRPSQRVVRQRVREVAPASVRRAARRRRSRTGTSVRSAPLVRVAASS